MFQLPKGYSAFLVPFLVFVVVLAAIGITSDPALAQNVACFFEQGGAKFVGSTYRSVSCELELRTGTTLDVQAGNITTFANHPLFTGNPAFTGTVYFSGTTTLNSSTLTGTISGNPTFIGTVNFTGTTTVNGTTTFTGSIAGNPTYTGDPTFSGSATFSGMPTFSDGFTAGGITSTVGITITNGDLTIADNLIVTAQTVISPTDGGIITATGTYQPISSAGAVTVTIETSGVTAGTHIILENTTATAILILNTGTTKLAGDITLGQYDSLHVRYDGTNWIEVSRSNNTPTAGALVSTAVITVGTEADTGANQILVGVQFQDVDGDDMTVAAAVPFYLADDAAGLDPSSGAPSVGTSISGDGALIEWTTNLSGLAISETDGDIFIIIEEAATPTFYLVFVMPDGTLVVSGAITFA